MRPCVDVLARASQNADTQEHRRMRTPIDSFAKGAQILRHKSKAPNSPKITGPRNKRAYEDTQSRCDDVCSRTTHICVANLPDYGKLARESGPVFFTPARLEREREREREGGREERGGGGRERERERERASEREKKNGIERVRARARARAGER